jgi:hypothetical protein
VDFVAIGHGVIASGELADAPNQAISPSIEYELAYDQLRPIPLGYGKQLL